MADPADKGTAAPLPTLGEGCLARYDPDAMSENHGTDFPGAADLWRQLSPPDAASAPAMDAPAGRQTPGRPPADKSSK
ncbi:hypothetical protein PVV54_04845 [Pseudomonas sp. PSKL.D1]|uniref:hypothetical protein n=1 Tax=Pseudomonas sp. PSKL.D1 TaxID=3029060 RepID=UPI00238163C2|nr:hypothetical protein [Pseudomonas sp. PSKL.D1]WDY58966.1 hypothetical protein PVV54_04845 [Pseudomonas sp. PSKL.D1]